MPVSIVGTPLSSWPRLRSLCAEHSLRSTFLRQLMSAHYRSGKETQVLAAYQEIHDRLVEELGVDRGPPLRDLYERIFRGLDEGVLERAAIQRSDTIATLYEDLGPLLFGTGRA
jgi:DNA-binding SARP family transcriptional activator